MSRTLYRASRFYVPPNQRARHLWVRYQTVPAVIGGYVLVASFLFVVGFIALVEVCRLYPTTIRRILFALARAAHELLNQ